MVMPRAIVNTHYRQQQLGPEEAAILADKAPKQNEQLTLKEALLLTGPSSDFQRPDLARRPKESKDSTPDGTRKARGPSSSHGTCLESPLEFITVHIPGGDMKPAPEAYGPRRSSTPPYFVDEPQWLKRPRSAIGKHDSFLLPRQGLYKIARKPTSQQRIVFVDPWENRQHKTFSSTVFEIEGDYPKTKQFQHTDGQSNAITAVISRGGQTEEACQHRVGDVESDNSELEGGYVGFTIMCTSGPHRGDAAATEWKPASYWMKRAAEED